MPKTLMDWLAVAGLWIGAGIEALVQAKGQFNLNPAVHPILTSGWWSLAPFGLVTFACTVFLFRSFRRTPVESGPGSQAPVVQREPWLTEWHKNLIVWAGVLIVLNFSLGLIGWLFYGSHH